MGKGPGPQLRSRLGSFGGQGQEHLDRVLQGHPLNCAVEVIVPVRVQGVTLQSSHSLC